MCLHSVLKQVHRQVVVIFMRKSFLFLSNRATQLDAMCKNMISYFSTSNLPLYLEDFSSLKDLMNMQLFFHTGAGMGSMILLNGCHLPGLTSWLNGTENLIQCVWCVDSCSPTVLFKWDKGEMLAHIWYRYNHCRWTSFLVCDWINPWMYNPQI